MKTRKMITVAALFMAVVVYSTTVIAQDQVSIKDIKKEFTVNANTKLVLSNIYGNVDVLNTEEPSLTIQVSIKVNSRYKNKADEILKDININISQTGDMISAATELGKDFGKIFSGFNFGDNGLEIDYTVTMPKTVPLNLENKYGNVFVNELTATSTLDVKYGKLSANKILHNSKEPLSKIYLAYSNGTIQECQWLELDIKYSKMNITNSKALVVLSKYSKISVSTGSSIVCDSKYDAYELGKFNNLVTTTEYSHYNVDELSRKLQVDSKYTDVIIGKIPADFESIKITNSYGTYKIGIDQGASYRLDGYAKYCSITYPTDNAKVNLFNENNEMKVNGLVGNNTNTKQTVSVSSNYGNIKLVQ